MTTSPSYEDLARENQALKTRIRSLEEQSENKAQSDVAANGTILCSLFQSLPLNIYAKDLNGRFIFANRFFCSNVGKTHEEIIGTSDFDILPPDLAENMPSLTRK